MNFIQKYFNNRHIKKEEEKKYNELAALAIQEYNETLKQRMSAENEREVILASDVPWYKLVGEPYNLESPALASVSDRYEWNKAFIIDLRKKGFSGESDAELISAWEKSTAIETAERMVTYTRAQKKASSEPWVEILSDEYDEDNKQVSLTLDWNSAFIKMLRLNGYSGSSEQEIIDKWFRRLSETIAEENAAASYDK